MHSSTAVSQPLARQLVRRLGRAGHELGATAGLLGPGCTATEDDQVGPLVNRPHVTRASTSVCGGNRHATLDIALSRGGLIDQPHGRCSGTGRSDECERTRNHFTHIVPFHSPAKLSSS